jgi:hypothetical protein
MSFDPEAKEMPLIEQIAMKRKGIKQMPFTCKLCCGRKDSVGYVDLDCL